MLVHSLLKSKLEPLANQTRPWLARVAQVARVMGIVFGASPLPSPHQADLDLVGMAENAFPLQAARGSISRGKEIH